MFGISCSSDKILHVSPPLIRLPLFWGISGFITNFETLKHSAAPTKTRCPIFPPVPQAHPLPHPHPLHLSPLHSLPFCDVEVVPLSPPPRSRVGRRCRRPRVLVRAKASSLLGSQNRELNLPCSSFSPLLLQVEHRVHASQPGWSLRPESHRCERHLAVSRLFGFCFAFGRQSLTASASPDLRQSRCSRETPSVCTS